VPFDKTVAVALASMMALASMTGCKPKIGDACSNAVDCSALGDRLCDVTQPGGYCTLFNCQPDTCPDDAACVVFRSELDPACEKPITPNSTLSPDGRHGRFAQTFCMKTCKSEKDCREGYQCVRPIDRAARLLDRKRDNAADVQVCLAVATLPTLPAVAPGVCSPGSAEPLKPYKPMTTASSAQSTGAAGGKGGQGGQGGAAGASGQGGVAGAGGI
jgi:hypothetical protein